MLAHRRTFCLTIEYDGTDFYGWQVQPNRRTVQGVLQEKLGSILDQSVKLVAAGRTDTGVHALGQVASFEAKTRHGAETLERALNGLLPEDVGVSSVCQVPAGFHARFDALWRRYRYRISRRRKPLESKHVWFVHYALDVERMRRGTDLLLGEHDFRSFCSVDASEGSYLSDVHWCRWAEHEDEIWFEIEADRFLHGMVRTIVGTSVDVGRGKVPPARMKEILEARDRRAAGMTAPACGLYLLSVAYPARTAATTPRSATSNHA